MQREFSPPILKTSFSKKRRFLKPNDTVVPSVVLFAVVAGDHQIAEETEYGKLLGESLEAEAGASMASTAKIQEKIAEIVGRPHNVRFDEIEWVMTQLGASQRPSKHGRLFKVGDRRIMINEHNNGRDTVPKYSVDDFRDLMVELDLL